MSNKLNSASDALLFKQLLEKELLILPLETWGGFTPCLIATWRFIREKYTDLIGELNAGYNKDGPYFMGKGADWFVDELTSSDSYLDIVEAIMYPLVDALKPHPMIFQRGYLKQGEVPEISLNLLEQLSLLVQSKIVEGISRKIIM